MPLDQLDYPERTVTQEHDDVKVSVSVLTRDEARLAFGDKLDEKRIQPVWISIENKSNKPYLLILHGIDPDYFTQREAAAVSKSGMLANNDYPREAFFEALLRYVEEDLALNPL